MAAAAPLRGFIPESGPASTVPVAPGPPPLMPRSSGAGVLQGIGGPGLGVGGAAGASVRTSRDIYNYTAAQAAAAAAAAGSGPGSASLSTSDVLTRSILASLGDPGVRR